MIRTGINAHIPSTLILDKIHEAGIKHIRCDFNWDRIEPKKGQYMWEPFDTLVDEASQRDIEVLPVIGYTPKWANYGSSPNTPPLYRDQWKKFVEEVVIRYPEIYPYEIWNEPNVSKYFNSTVDYYIQKILIPAADVIHNVGGFVVAPGIDTTNSQWSHWLEKIEEHKDVIDIVSLHHYNTPAFKAIKMLERGTWRGRRLPCWFPDERSILDMAKRISDKIWITETGWSTVDVSEFEQCLYYQDMREWKGPIDRIYFYEMVDDPSTDEKFGILDANLGEKLTYNTLKYVYG